MYDKEVTQYVENLSKIQRYYFSHNDRNGYISYNTFCHLLLVRDLYPIIHSLNLLARGNIACNFHLHLKNVTF